MRGVHAVIVPLSIYAALELDMGYWETLDQAVETTLRHERIGTPVFVRCTAAVAESVGMIQNRLAEMIGSVNRWVGASPCRLYALRTKVGAHLTVTLEYPPGVSAVLAVTPAHANPQIDLVILGSRGAIYHHDCIKTGGEAPCAELETVHKQPILTAIQRSCTSGKPVELSPEVGN